MATNDPMFREITNTIIEVGFLLLLFGLLLAILLQAVLEFSSLPMLVARAVAGAGF
jgi:hypothetical protein